MAQVLVHERLLRKIERAIDSLSEAKEEYISEAEAAKFLGLTVKTMQNYVCSGKITSSVYVINVLGNRMYKKSKLILNP